MRYESSKAVDVRSHPKMKEKEAIAKLVKALDEPSQSGFVFGSIGDDKTLCLIFKHNAHVQEFNFKSQQILQKMREIYKNEKLQNAIYFKKVVAKCAPIKGVNATKVAKDDTKSEYCEQSTGSFKNNCKNEKIRGFFEDIREIIKARCEI